MSLTSFNCDTFTASLSFTPAVTLVIGLFPALIPSFPITTSSVPGVAPGIVIVLVVTESRSFRFLLHERLDWAIEQTAHLPGVRVNIAVGYGGRQEIVDAVRSVLREAAAKGTSLEDMADLLNVEDISSHLYTSGEQRLSGFMTWQSAYSEFYFCRALWPDFTRVDFLRALRDYANRSRRFGS